MSTRYTKRWNMRTNEVVVAGGGAAGMMAAITAARAGASVVLLEPNEKVGRKLYITGKGRCNLTNNCGRDALMASIPRNGKFLYSAFDRFGPADVMAFFEELGVKLKTERGNRVFPVSNKSADIVDALFFELRHQGVEVRQDRAVGLEVQDGQLSAVRTETGKDFKDCKALILATGGASYPRTGSTGEGYALAREAGHTVIPIRGSLVPLESADPCCGRLQGLSMRNVELRVKDGRGKVVFREQGELLFTHFGLSGPLVLSASAHMDFRKSQYTAHIDLKPALDEQRLDARLLRDFEERANQDYANALGGLVPRSMVPVLAARTGVPADTKVHDIRREQRRRLLDTRQECPISRSGPRPVEEAVVTSGGGAVGEVDPRTMESNKARGVFLAGELLDVDGYTGGFNLQIAWSTGYAAGLAAAERAANR